jgi:nucleotide-binding universal stress UspA family protein
MKPIARILCPTDFGASAHGALRQAVRLAECHAASIDLLHVANVPHYVRRDMVGIMGSSGARPLQEIALEEAEKEMVALLADLSPNDRERITTECKFGTPITTIIQYAEAHQADLIVMGASGKVRVAKYILGGTAGKTIRRAHCPVMCVPGDEVRDFQRILVATDFSACSERALELGAFMAAAARARLVVAHVTPSAWSLPPGLNVGSVGQEAHWLELLQREAREQLDEFVDKHHAYGNEQVVERRELLIGSPAQSLLQYAEKENVDLMVLGTHGRSAVARLMLGSVAETVVHHAKVPVLTVRSELDQQKNQGSEDDA